MSVSLSTQLMRLACDVDDIVTRIERRADQVRESDGLRFQPALTHLSMSVDRLSDVLYKASTYGTGDGPREW